MNRFQRFYYWLQNQDAEEKDPHIWHYSVRAKAIILIALGFIILAAIILLVIWLDNWVRLNL